MAEKRKTYYERMLAAGARRSKNVIDERQSVEDKEVARGLLKKATQYVDYVDYASLGKGGPLKRWPNGRSKSRKGE